MKDTKTIICILGFLLGILWLSVEMKAERGIASYYHDKFHGRRMANGEKYNRDSFTCAHLRYPFGTFLKVKNIRNGKECIVKVTDRGPYSKRFAIDLSKAAARHLDIIYSGHAPVEITRVTVHHGGVIPYRLDAEEEPEELPDLELDFVPAATYPFPAWTRDSIPPDDPQPSDTPRSTSKVGSERQP